MTMNLAPSNPEKTEYRATGETRAGPGGFGEHIFPGARLLKSAEAAFESARAADPKFGPLYIWLGNYYMVQKDAKHAEDAL